MERWPGVPQPPNVDGLPLWLQIVLSLLFVVTTAGIAFVGYRQRLEREPSGAATTVMAAFPDMTAIRQLTDTCRLLCQNVEQLNATLTDHTHYLRNKIDVDAELAHRARELTDEIIRSERQRAQREGRVPPAHPM